MIEDVTIVRLEGVGLLILSIVVLFFGELAKSQMRVLRNYNIPSAVIGGLLCASVIAALRHFEFVEFEFGSRIRDTLLLAFFSTVGLSVKLENLHEDAKAILLLLVLASALLIFQDMAGSAVAAAIGIDPGYGLLAGSVSFVGGHGTSVAWSEILAARFSLPDADDIALSCATFGLVLGGLVGGPLARWLIVKNELQGDVSEAAHTPSAESVRDRGPVTLNSMLSAILLVALCIGIAVISRPWIAQSGLTIPDFVVALVAGVVLTNLFDAFKVKMNVASVGLISDVSLQIFLAISIMTIELWLLPVAVGPLFTVLVLQVVMILVLTYFIVFPVMGRDYDAAVICAGFVGFGLGATPVGLANMRAVTNAHGASSKAFIVVPVVGAFLVDLVNALVLQFYLASPVFD